MAMGSSWVKQFMYGCFGLVPEEGEGTAERDARDYLRRRESEALAVAVFDFFNLAISEGRNPWYVPTVKAALLAKRPWLIVLCRSCDTLIDLDMRVKPRPPSATILMPLAEVRCPRCSGHGRPSIYRLSEGPTPTVSKPPYIPPDPRKPW